MEPTPDRLPVSHGGIEAARIISGERRLDRAMQDQAPLSPARAMFEELRENEDAGSFDSFSEPREIDEPVTAQNPTAASSAAGPETGFFLAPEANSEQAAELATRRVDRIGIDPAGAGNVEQIYALDEDTENDTTQPRSALAAIIRLQSTEIEHQALENDQLAARLDKTRQLIEAEKILRHDLEQKLREADARIAPPPAPAFDIEEVRRATREGLSAEVKPVLVAILDLLETTMSRVSETEMQTLIDAPAVEEAVADTPAQTAAEAVAQAAAQMAAQTAEPANLFADVMDEFHQLPEILTRPLDELTTRSVEPLLEPQPVVVPPAPTAVSQPYAPQSHAPRPQAQRPHPPRHERQTSAIPSAFAWTNLFS